MCRAATTLCALHYIACSVSIWVTQTFGGVKRVTLPFSGDPVLHRRFTCCKYNAPKCLSHIHRPNSTACADLVLFTATANVSIVSLNLSLMINQVGFYQVSCPCLRVPVYAQGDSDPRSEG